MTLTKLLDEYLSRRVLRPPTERTYRYVVASVTTAKDEDPPLSALTEDWWVDFRGRQLLTTSAVTFNSKRRHLLCLLDWAVATGRCDRNALRDVGRAPVARLRKKLVSDESLRSAIRYLEGDEVRGGGSPLFDPSWFWLAVLTTLYYTGMRRRQLIELAWGDIDFGSGTITLRAESSKTRREWTVPIAVELATHLRRLFDETTAVLGHKLDPLGQVFCLPLFVSREFPSGRLQPDYLTSWFNELQRQLPEGARGISAHRLRHTTATHLVRNQGNLKAVQV
jgi:integrase